ncbi:MAG TPA: VIT domain-containing protein [Pyrinomonadaceae bacterium]|nr:VIT domain-containing protein [Pyrinomonadaceae bacterium]
MRKVIFTVTGILLAFLAFSTAAKSQGVIVPIICDIRPCRPIPPPVPFQASLPIKSIKFDTNISDQTATTKVEQIFRNDTNYTLEGIFFFAIPDGAAISDFAIWENDKRLTGEVRTRDQARQIYNEIVRKQRDPGLLEFIGKNIIQASIFPIPPNSDKKLEITYTQVLKADSGSIAYVYPIGLNRSPIQRREPVAATSGYSRPEVRQISGIVRIDSSRQLGTIYSPTHQISVDKRSGGRSAIVTMDAAGANSDFKLYYGYTESAIGASMITYREPGKDGYFLLTITPGEVSNSFENKDIVLVIDTSGSMADQGKLDKAKAALKYAVETLRDSDNFNIVAFSGDVRLMETGMIAANSQGKKRGREFIESLKPSGGTNIADALQSAIRQFKPNERPKMLVFMTDGNPTVGLMKTDQILDATKKAAKESVPMRIFTFGFGFDVNTSLLDAVATDNGGMSDYVAPDEDLEVKVSNFVTKISSPVLTDLSINYGSLETEMIYPRDLGDLFNGGQIVVIGRYKNSQAVSENTITVSGRIKGQKRDFTFRNINAPLRSETNDFLPRLWAARRVGWLLEELRRNGESSELKTEVIELATRYGLITPYTSYLAVEDEMAPLPMSAAERDRIANEAAKSMANVSGAPAVSLSKKQNNMKSSISLARGDKKDSVFADSKENIKFVGAKTFVYTDGEWRDLELTDKVKLPLVEVKTFSKEYFDLVSSIPDLAKYFSLGDKVAVILDGKIYRCSPE